MSLYYFFQIWARRQNYLWMHIINTIDLCGIQSSICYGSDKIHLTELYLQSLCLHSLVWQKSSIIFKIFNIERILGIFIYTRYWKSHHSIIFSNLLIFSTKIKPDSGLLPDFRREHKKCETYSFGCYPAKVYITVLWQLCINLLKSYVCFWKMHWCNTFCCLFKSAMWDCWFCHVLVHLGVWVNLQITRGLHAERKECLDKGNLSYSILSLWLLINVYIVW